MKTIVILLLIVVIYILLTNTEDPLLTEIKRRYDYFLNHLPPGQFDILKQNRAIISVKERGGDIAFNVNKGYEIYMCLDGKKINPAMYILLHELAHITVEEYDHSERFWSNFRKLREIASDMGVYTPEHEMEYCGQTIKDSLVNDSS